MLNTEYHYCVLSESKLTCRMITYIHVAVLLCLFHGCFSAEHSLTSKSSDASKQHGYTFHMTNVESHAGLCEMTNTICGVVKMDSVDTNVLPLVVKYSQEFRTSNTYTSLRWIADNVLTTGMSFAVVTNILGEDYVDSYADYADIIVYLGRRCEPWGNYLCITHLSNKVVSIDWTSE